MQSSVENSLPLCRRNGTSADELEDGEIGDDEDDELWQQLESTLETSAHSPASRASSPFVGSDSPLYSQNNTSSSNLISSSKVTRSLQTDRLAGGFWAKLKTVTSQNQSVECSKSDSSMDAANERPSFGTSDTRARFPVPSRASSRAIPSNYVPLAEDPKTENDRLGPSFGLRDTDEATQLGSRDDSIEVESSPSKRRKVSKSSRGDLRISFPSSENASSGLAGMNNGEKGDEEELLELQLRLEALQSTMKRGDAKESSRRSTRNRKDSATSGIYSAVSTGARESGIKPSEVNRRSARGSAYRDDSRIPGRSDFDADYRRRKRQRCRRNRSERSQAGAKQIDKNDVGGSKEDFAKDRSSQTFRAKAIRNASKKRRRRRQLQHERERILSMPDPKDQFHAFLDLVTTPRVESTQIRQECSNSGLKTKYGEDNLEATNMEISSDSEDDTRTRSSGYVRPPSLAGSSVSSALSGFWCRPSSSKQAERGSTTSSVLRELDNTGKKQSDTRSSQPTSIAPASGGQHDDKCAYDQGTIVIDDDEDEEMEALRELALTSMMKSKDKKKQSPLVSVAEEGCPASPRTIIITSAENSPPNGSGIKDLEEQTDSEETEVVITLDKEFLKKHVELARKRIHEERNKTSAAGKSAISKRASSMETPTGVVAGPEKVSTLRTTKATMGIESTKSSATNESQKFAQAVGRNFDSLEKAIIVDACEKDRALYIASTVDSASLLPSPSFDEAKARDSLQRPTRSLVTRNKLSQVLKVVHKPLLIPLDSSSSDEGDEEVKSTASTVGQDRARVPDAGDTTSVAASVIKPTTRALLEDLLKGRSNGKKNGSASTQGDGVYSPVKNGSALSSNASLIRQLEARLRVCVDDLSRHQYGFLYSIVRRNSLTEDEKRLCTLESIVSRQKTDLRLAEMRMQKLKQELRVIESQSASYRVSIAKFNGEIQKVQSRVDKNFELQRLYLRQWKEIEQLVAKYKIDLLPKVPQTASQTSLLKPRHLNVGMAKRFAPRKLSAIKKRLSKSSETARGDSKKSRAGGVKSAKANVAKGQPLANVPAVPDKAKTVNEDLQSIYSSPLRWFRSYRLSPCFRTLDQHKHDSTTFSNKLNPLTPLCPFDLSGQCLDPECGWQHARDYLFTDVEMIVDLLSYRPDVVAEGADEKTTVTFAADLYNSLHVQLPLNDILLYCLSKMDSQARDRDGARLGVETEPRRWIVGPNSSCCKNGSTEPKEPIVGDGIRDERSAETGQRYFCGVPTEESRMKESIESSPVNEAQRSKAGQD